MLWDIVVAGDLQGKGSAPRRGGCCMPAVAGVERVYLMTTNSSGFYRQLGFQMPPQQLLVLKR